MKRWEPKNILITALSIPNQEYETRIAELAEALYDRMASLDHQSDKPKPNPLELDNLNQNLREAS